MKIFPQYKWEDERMKKLFLAVVVLLIFTGCNDMTNTPTKKVEDFLGKYQSMDSDVLAQLDDVIEDDVDMKDEQKKDYKSLMEKQYQNLSYKIKNENTDGDKATVDVEVEVYDYRSALDKAETYRKENKDEFLDEDDKEDSSKYMDYKIAELKKVSDKRKYTITFNLHKDDGEWVLDDISDRDREKLHGLYLE